MKREKSDLKKIALIRVDKIGDLVATMAIDEIFPTSDITWIIEDSVKFLAENSVPPRRYLSLSLKNSFTSFKFLVRALKSFDMALVFYAPWWVSLALFVAGVPVRAGRKSQWHSFLFLNQTLRQSRSASEKHEAEYNRDLADFFIEKNFSIKTIKKTPVLKLAAPPHFQLLEKWNLQSQKYIVIHPGMAGSALNWPQKNYNSLIAKLMAQNTVVITGTAMDEPWLSEIKDQWQHHPKVRWTQSQLSLNELLFLLSRAQKVVAPSTGVLHLAASLGTPVIGIYSPTLAHSSRRWGPRSEAPVSVVEPQSESENCMDQISVEEVLSCLK